VIEENKRGVGRVDDLNNFVELALANETGGIGLLAALNEGGGNGSTS
jgi:hypothetical protein